MDADAKFWMTKYFELLGHTSQVMGKLAAPELRGAMQAQAAAVAEALKTQEGQGK